MNDGYTIYWIDQQDMFFFRSALRTVMQASELLRMDYGKFADTITFKGECCKIIYDNFIEKNYNLGAELKYAPGYVDEIVLSYSKKIKISKGDVISSIGFEFTVEKEVSPETVISIVKF